MCGSSKQQNDINSTQIQLQKQMVAAYNEQFQQNQSILNTLVSSLKPLVSAGPSTEGMSPEEKAALTTQATESAAQSASQTKEAINTSFAGRENNPDLTAPGKEMLNEQADVAAENELAKEKLGITVSSFEKGTAQYDKAIAALSGVPGSIESASTNVGTGAVNAGSSAANEANAINQSNNSWMGILGGIAGNAIGGLTGGLGSKLFGGKSSSPLSQVAPEDIIP